MKPNLGDVLADKYRLDRVLGEGGMSTVFAAVNVLTGKPVAIKWLEPELVRDEEQSARLIREAQATSVIDHPNVVNLFDIGAHRGAMFLVMELLHGEPLSELLVSGPQTPTEFVRLMMPVLRGVHAAHRKGIVHRDLKPDNIFVCRDADGMPREPKVLDFGISKIADSALLLNDELTREGTVFGTPQYMAPEQMRDARVADVRSDIYALGVIFYRALADEYPYDADTLTALAIRIVEGAAVPLYELYPHIDPALSDAIMRALALDPDDRYQSVAAFAEALEPFADGLTFAPNSERASWPALPTRARESAPHAMASAGSQRLPLAAGSRPSQRVSAARSSSTPTARVSRIRSPGRATPVHALSIPRPREQSGPLARSQPRERSQPIERGQPAERRPPLARPRAEHGRTPTPRQPAPRQLAHAAWPPAPLRPDDIEIPSAFDETPLGTPLVGARPSMGLELPLHESDDTQRITGLARAPRRRPLVLGLVLFSIGLAGAVGVQLLQRSKLAHSWSAGVAVEQPPSTRLTRTLHAMAGAALGEAPTAALAPPPAANGAADASLATPPELPLGREAPEDAPVSAHEAPSKRKAAKSARAPRAARGQGAASSSTSTATPAREEKSAPRESERDSSSR